MRSTVTAFFVVLSLAAVAAFAVGQQRPSELEPTGSYAVAGLEKGAVLLDRQSGKTWILQHSADHLQPSVWLPAVKIDSRDEAGDWRKSEQAREVVANQRNQLQREIYSLKDQQAQIKAISPQNAKLQAIEKQITEREAILNQLQ